MLLWLSLWVGLMPYESVDNALEILARHIVQNKRDVISFLNENGYAELRDDAPIIEVNEAVSKHIFDKSFLTKLSQQIFGEFSNATGASAASTASSGASQASNANPITWVIKIFEVGSLFALENQRINQEDRALAASYALAEQQLENEQRIAKEQAQQDFAFSLLAIQRAQSGDKTVQNVILMGGVIAFLIIAYYATRRKA